MSLLVLAWEAPEGLTAAQVSVEHGNGQGCPILYTHAIHNSSLAGRTQYNKSSICLFEKLMHLQWATRSTAPEQLIIKYDSKRRGLRGGLPTIARAEFAGMTRRACAQMSKSVLLAGTDTAAAECFAELQFLLNTQPLILGARIKSSVPVVTVGVQGRPNPHQPTSA
eukprot:169122-Pelagomonas_calceolata.AAC.1